MNLFPVQVVATIASRRNAHAKAKGSTHSFIFQVEANSPQEAVQSTADIFCKEDGYTVSLAGQVQAL